jgi:hypothetical protein
MIQGFPAKLITELLKDVDDHIHDQRIQLLWMPDAESLSALGEDICAIFGADKDGLIDDEIDGDSFLSPVERFSDEQIAAALEAGGELLWGYEFDYPQRVIRPWDMRLHDWWGDARRGVAYALWFDVAVVVCALAHGKSVSWLDCRRRR